jgi:hypothetical protein
MKNSPGPTSKCHPLLSTRRRLTGCQRLLAKASHASALAGSRNGPLAAASSAHDRRSATRGPGPRQQRTERSAAEVPPPTPTPLFAVQTSAAGGGADAGGGGSGAARAPCFTVSLRSSFVADLKPPAALESPRPTPSSSASSLSLGTSSGKATGQYQCRT